MYTTSLEMLRVTCHLNSVEYKTDDSEGRQLELLDHDAYTWTSLVTEKPLVTAATQVVLADYARDNSPTARQRRTQ